MVSDPSKWNKSKSAKTPRRKTVNAAAKNSCGGSSRVSSKKKACMPAIKKNMRTVMKLKVSRMALKMGTILGPNAAKPRKKKRTRSHRSTAQPARITRSLASRLPATNTCTPRTSTVMRSQSMPSSLKMSLSKHPKYTTQSINKYKGVCKTKHPKYRKKPTTHPAHEVGTPLPLETVATRSLRNQSSRHFSNRFFPSLTKTDAA
mmetsp:Transcript_103706/g.317564  ORF Transcript_103706/g.317564 Transcript_103706/m.317564 type:complete len:204 (-) Transcript_103706:942-1553(-)